MEARRAGVELGRRKELGVERVLCGDFIGMHLIATRMFLKLLQCCNVVVNFVHFFSIR